MNIEVIFYSGDLKPLKLTLQELNPLVDRFVIIEAKKDERGKQKPRFFFRQERYVEPFWPKIDYFVVDSMDATEQINKILEHYKADNV